MVILYKKKNQLKYVSKTLKIELALMCLVCGRKRKNLCETHKIDFDIYLNDIKLILTYI